MSDEGEDEKAKWVWDPFRIDTEEESVAATRCGAIVGFFIFLEFVYEAIAPIIVPQGGFDLIVIIVNVVIAAFFLFLTIHIYRRHALWAVNTVAVFFALTVVNAVIAMRSGHVLSWWWVLPVILSVYLLILGVRGTLKLQEIRRLRNVAG